MSFISSCRYQPYRKDLSELPINNVSIEGSLGTTKVAYKKPGGHYYGEVNEKRSPHGLGYYQEEMRVVEGLWKNGKLDTQGEGLQETANHFFAAMEDHSRVAYDEKKIGEIGVSGKNVFAFPKNSTVKQVVYTKDGDGIVDGNEVVYYRTSKLARITWRKGVPIRVSSVRYSGKEWKIERVSNPFASVPDSEDIEAQDLFDIYLKKSYLASSGSKIFNLIGEVDLSKPIDICLNSNFILKGSFLEGKFSGKEIIVQENKRLEFRWFKGVPFSITRAPIVPASIGRQ